MDFYCYYLFSSSGPVCMFVAFCRHNKAHFQAERGPAARGRRNSPLQRPLTPQRKTSRSSSPVGAPSALRLVSACVTISQCVCSVMKMNQDLGSHDVGKRPPDTSADEKKD